MGPWRGAEPREPTGEGTHARSSRAEAVLGGVGGEDQWRSSLPVGLNSPSGRQCTRPLRARPGNHWLAPHRTTMRSRFSAPGNAKPRLLTDRDVFLPDVLVVPDPSHVSNRGIEKPPLLIVEILSPATRKQDRGTKAQRYAELGVEHYWIVDPEEKRIECHRSVRGTFRQLGRRAGRDDARASRLERSDRRSGRALAVAGQIAGYSA